MILKMQTECMNYGQSSFTLEGAYHHHNIQRQKVLMFFLHSGPHHGHYVSIIKSNGNWLLFDDDVVTVSSTYICCIKVNDLTDI